MKSDFDLSQKKKNSKPIVSTVVIKHSIDEAALTTAVICTFSVSLKEKKSELKKVIDASLYEF